MDQTFRDEQSWTRWRGSITDLRSVIDDTVVAVQDLTRRDHVPVDISVYWHNRDVNLKGTEDLSNVLNGNLEGLRRISVQIGDADDGIAVRLGVSTAGLPAIELSVFGSRQSAVNGAFVHICQRIDQGRYGSRSQLIPTLLGLTAGALLLTAVVLAATSDADSDSTWRAYGAGVAIAAIAGLFALGRAIFLPPIDLKQDGDSGARLRWRQRLGTGVWALGLVTLGAFLEARVF